MPVQPYEVLWFLSNPNASAGYTGTGTAGNSLGGYMSTTQINSASSLDDLFLDISGAQNAAGQVDYQCLFLMNNTASLLPMNAIFLWFPVALWTYNGAGMAVAVDPIGAVAYNRSTRQAALIANSLTPPSTVTTWSPGPHTTFGSGISAGALQPNYCLGVWIQRTAQNTPILTPQTLSLQATYQSNA